MPKAEIRGAGTLLYFSTGTLCDAFPLRPTEVELEHHNMSTFSPHSHLLGTYYIPGAILNILYTTAHLNLTTTVGGRDYLLVPTFYQGADGDTERLIHPRMHSVLVAEPEFTATWPGAQDQKEKHCDCLWAVRTQHSGPPPTQSGPCFVEVMCL